LANEVVKKVRVPSQSLPPVTIPSIAGINIISVISKTDDVSGAKVYEYTTSEDHNFVVGDSVIISEVDPDLFNAENIVIYSVPTPNTFQTLGPSTSTLYFSGGIVSKTYGNYIVRYRIISEDRNRVSHWSPLYILSPYIAGYEADQGITVQVVNSILSVTWDIPANSSLKDFDVYVAWGVGATIPGSNEGVGVYTYQATVSGNFFSMPVPDSSYTRVSVAIQTRTYPRKFWPDVVIARSSVINMI
jgi:hypothetical protein